jgi:predicted nuclease with TOPRIM domain
MARRTVSLDEKIERAQAEVVSAKERYDRALDELEKLLTKRQELENKELIKAFTASNKSLAEVVAFLNGNSDEINEG